MVEIYRVEPRSGEPRPRRRRRSSRSSRRRCRPGTCAASADLLAARVAAGSTDTQAHEPLDGGGELVRAGALVARRDGPPVGVVIASDFLSGRSRAARPAHRRGVRETTASLRVLKRPLEGVYLSLFLMMTLMILVSATWLGLYLAKRITRPVQHAGGRRARDRRRAISITASSRRRATSSARWSRRSTRWRASWPRASSGSSDRARPRAQELGARRAPPLHRDDARADCDRRGLDRRRRPGRARSTRRRCACSTSIAAIVGAPADEVFAREDLQPRRGAHSLGATPVVEAGRHRRSRSPAAAARSTWRQPRPRCREAARTKARCSCSTT